MTEHNTLPQDFFFGAALSGPQTEGAWQSYGKIENTGTPGPIWTLARSTTVWARTAATT